MTKVLGTPPLEAGALIAEARARTGLSDIGDTRFMEPFAAQLASLNGEARLTELARAQEAERFVAYLSNRLMRVRLLDAHSEILDEEIDVAAVIISLARTGSTKAHRMFGVTPGHTTVKTWENFFPLPLDGEERGNPHERRARAQAILDTQPDQSHIHPMSLDSPEEEALILDQAFMGMVLETMFWAPSFGDYLMQADQRLAYEELRLVLQILQWQDPTRAGKRWILKSPTHMSAPRALLETFPGALLVQTHRDPLRTMPSHCSMNDNFIQAKCRDIPSTWIGPEACRRWGRMADAVIELRSEIGDARFIDIQYRDITQHPLEVTRAVYERLGTPMTAGDEAAVSAWLNANRREDAPPHHYDLESFGLSEAMIEDAFARYRALYCV